MEDKKYYWMSFEIGDLRVDDVSTEHPFIVITKLRRNPNYGALLNWRHISEEDYNLFNDILYNITKYVGDNNKQDNE